jgi:serine/threonine-protein kinase RsbW
MTTEPRKQTADFSGEEHGVQVALSLRLPRDRVSVPVVRHLAEYALLEVGAVSSDAHDVELALAEACANVLTHAGPGDIYDVDVIIGPRNCVIRVVDVGAGFDAPLAPSMPGAEAESGRGVGLMHAVMNEVRLTSEPDRGTVVQLVKSLRFHDDAPARQLMTHDLHRM